eukprot:3323324-Rhodomonas_salina.1
MPGVRLCGSSVGIACTQSISLSISLVFDASISWGNPGVARRFLCSPEAAWIIVVRCQNFDWENTRRTEAQHADLGLRSTELLHAGLCLQGHVDS